MSLCPLLPEISQLLTQTDARSARVETVELRPGRATGTGGRPSRAGAAQRETGDEKTETRGTFTVRGDSRDSTDDNRASVITVIVIPGPICILCIGQGEKMMRWILLLRRHGKVFQ